MTHSVKAQSKAAKPGRPPVNPKQILGAVIALVLGGVWLFDTAKGIPPPPVLGQGLVAAFGLLGVGSVKP